jgi:TP901 family phage tail tape measure protein
MLELDARSAAEQTATNLQTKVKQLLGFGAVLTQVSRITRQAINQIKELDAAMTQIAVVTDFTTAELWGQIDAYMALAKQYGVTTKGVYEVSQLYYQQGLNTSQVMTMTTETLKMAKIAGLDYGKATDYMTVAIRGFKLDVKDAGRVVDVYSKLAAIAATDTRELAVAMSKTASIAESAGMSIESTSSFLTLMIETTREAPENLGTAMKTIIARFQEMKKSPLELVEVEGEEISLNKVDKALQTVGISLTDASGQFKNLDDVIFELSGKWDSLDRNTQRYIATTVAGSRQQSRFLALMSDSERLTELYAESLDSEDAALLQYAKTLDSVESKINQVSTSFQQFYMSVLNGPVIGGAIDLFKALIEVLNQIPKAIGLIGLTGIIKGVKAGLMGLINVYKNGMRGATASTLGFKQVLALTFKTGASGATAFGATLAVALNWIWLIGAALTAVIALINHFNTTAEEAGEIAERDRIAAAQAKKDYKDLIGYEEALKKAFAEKNDSLEAKQRWLDLNREIAESYPQLIETYDKEGNAIVALGDKYKDLTQTQLEAAQAAQETALASTVTEQVKIINEASSGGWAYDKDDIASFERNVDFYRE